MTPEAFPIGTKRSDGLSPILTQPVDLGDVEDTSGDSHSEPSDEEKRARPVAEGMPASTSCFALWPLPMSCGAQVDDRSTPPYVRPTPSGPNSPVAPFVLPPMVAAAANSYAAINSVESTPSRRALASQFLDLFPTPKHHQIPVALGDFGDASSESSAQMGSVPSPLSAGSPTPSCATPALAAALVASHAVDRSAASPAAIDTPYAAGGSAASPVGGGSVHGRRFLYLSPSMDPCTPAGERQQFHPTPALMTPAKEVKNIDNVEGTHSVVSPEDMIVYWVVDAKLLWSKDKQAISWEFTLWLSEKDPAVPCVLVLHPFGGHLSKGGQGFLGTRGRGKIEFKSKQSSFVGRTACASISFMVGSKDPTKQQTVRGPVTHDFVDKSIASLPNGSDVWDFRKSVDECTQKFIVSVKIQNQKGLQK